MTRTLSALAVVLALTAPAVAQNPPQIRIKASALELLTADQAFAKLSAEKGLAAWEQYFAPDAVIFPKRGGIAEGMDAVKAAWAKGGFTPAGLRWTPKRAIMSESGDIGYTYGVWIWEGKGPNGKPSRATGKYITIWRKQPDGSYKIVLDTGTDDAPEPAKP